MKRMDQKGFSLIAVVLIVLGILILGTGGFFISSTVRVAEKEPERQEKGEPERVIDETADWEIYQNEEYGYELKYPKDWKIEIVNVDRATGREYVRFISPLINNKYYFVLNFGTRNKGDSTQISYQPDEDWELLKSLMRPGDKVKIGNVDVLTTEIVEKGKVNSILYSNRLGAGRIEISGLEIQADSGVIEGPQHLSASDVESIDFKDLPESKLASQILSTFKFTGSEEVDEEISRVEAPEHPASEEVEEEEEAVAPDTPIMKNIDTYSTPEIPYTIGWASLSEAETHILERDVDSSFSDPATVYSGPMNSFTETLSPLETTRYFFRVKACNGSECSPWSSISLLVIEVIADPDAPTEPTPSLPLGTPILSDPGDSIEPLVDPAGSFEASYNLSWQVVEGATGYVLQANSSYSFDAEWDPTWGFHEHNITGDNIGIQIQRVLSPTVFYYRVKAVNDSGESPWSNIVDIEVLPSQPSITVSSPNGGEMWKRGEKVHISWSSDQVDVAQIKIRNADTGSVLQIDRLSSDPHYYDWTIPLDFILGDRYEIQVLDPDNSQICDWSDKYFRIVSQSAASKSITLTSPDGGEVWRVGETHQITWDFVGVDSVKIYIFDPSVLGSGSTRYITPINISVSGTSGSYSWTIPSLGQLPGGGGDNYKINIVDASDSQTKDTSDDFFSIVVP